MLSRMKKFDDLFKDHQALIIDENFATETKLIVDFKQPDNNQDWFKFIYVDGILTIQSDYGHSMFTWWDKKLGINWISLREDEGYILEKCLCSSVNSIGEPFKEYDEREAKKAYSKMVDNIRANYAVKPGDFPRFDCSDYFEMINSVNRLYIFCNDYDISEEYINTYMGVITSRRFFVQWAALRKAIGQLVNKGIL